MGFLDKAAISAAELGAETAAGKAAIAACRSFVEEFIASSKNVEFLETYRKSFRPIGEVRSLGSATEYGLADGSYTNKELAKLIASKRLSSPFKQFENLNAFTAAPEIIPQGRIASGYFKRNEDYWLESMNSRFRRGDIDSSTLLVADTGHGATIGYAMANRFRSDIFMHLPRAKDAISMMRIQDQGQTFFKGIHDALQAGRVGSSTLLVLDSHLPALSVETVASLPTASQLRSLGVSKVFFGFEGRPFAAGPKPWSTSERVPLDNWLTRLHSDGIPVVSDGLDIRP